MQQLSPPDSIVRSLIGNRIYQRGRHKLSQYVIMRKHDGSVLLYHTMTCELLLLSLDEWKAYKMNRELYNRCFLTEEEADEFAFAKKIKRLRQMIYKKYTKDHLHTPITRFWILTTTGCNARCFYCHEKGIPNMVMTEETADRVIEYILAQKKDQLRFMWYGGEPTMRSNIIHKIAQAVSDHGITFTSGMISNGYLFDEELAKEAKELWNLTDIQITLDGMEKTYNKVKDYIYRDSASPFVRVIKNIRHLLENEVLVRVRLNVDIYNMDEIDILINYLSDEFNGYDNFSIYIAPLMEDCLGTDYIREEKDRAAVFSFYKQTSSRLMSRGMLTKSDLPSVYVYSHPQAGKHGIYTNTHFPVLVIGKLIRDKNNYVKKIPEYQAFPYLAQQSFTMDTPQLTGKILKLIRKIVQTVEFYEIHCNLDADSGLEIYNQLMNATNKKAN